MKFFRMEFLSEFKKNDRIQGSNPEILLIKLDSVRFSSRVSVKYSFVSFI